MEKKVTDEAKGESRLIEVIKSSFTNDADTVLFKARCCSNNWRQLNVAVYATLTQCRVNVLDYWERNPFICIVRRLGFLSFDITSCLCH